MNRESKMTFDTEQFIKEIEARNAIWDPYTEEYSDRECRRRLWEEVTCAMFDEEMSEDERSDISKLLQQKWKNIRTSFTREIRRRAGKAGSAANRKTPYVHFDSLKFLMPTVDPNRVQENGDTGQEEIDNEENRVCRKTSPLPTPRKKRRVDFNDELDQALQNCANMTKRREGQTNLEDIEADRDRLFFLSLLDDFKKIPDQKKLTAKMEIIRVIRWAQKVPHKRYNTRNLYTDHNYVKQRSFQSSQSKEEGKCPRKYTASPNLLFPRDEKFLHSDTDVSNESEVLELLTQDVPNDCKELES
ncbi:uncharacterized protein [Epargyreus clarus]|uniref:uncharacterized protein n=1 Tax=Epargyreus clarus TaxID=520877 RepID=UPI003C2F4FD5